MKELKIKTSTSTTIHLHTPFGLSPEGNYHLVLLALTFGKGACGMYLLGFFIGYSWGK